MGGSHVGCSNLMGLWGNMLYIAIFLVVASAITRRAFLRARNKVRRNMTTAGALALAVQITLSAMLGVMTVASVTLATSGCDLLNKYGDYAASHGWQGPKKTPDGGAVTCLPYGCTGICAGTDISSPPQDGRIHPAMAASCGVDPESIPKNLSAEALAAGQAILGFNCPAVNPNGPLMQLWMPAQFYCQAQAGCAAPAPGMLPQACRALCLHLPGYPESTILVDCPDPGWVYTAAAMQRFTDKVAATSCEPDVAQILPDQDDVDNSACIHRSPRPLDDTDADAGVDSGAMP